MGLTLADLFPDHRSPDDNRRARLERLNKRLADERKREHDGARLDALREAEKFILCARDIDISQWSDTQLDAALNRLAEAHALLDTEER